MFIEQLTADEKAMIDELRHSISDSDGDFCHGRFAEVDSWLWYWEHAKESSPFLKAVFGNQLILKKRISVTMEDDELYNKMDSLMWEPSWGKIKTDVVSSIVERNDIWGLTHMLRSKLFCVEAFVSNKYDGDSIELNLPDGSVFKLNRGCKAMKAIARLVKSCGQEYEEMFEPIRLRQSQIMNDANINTTLCISIHPLDYMTASLNSNNWRSCMCWNDGEYRRGVIEMMNSPMVIVAYLESSHEKLSIGWNSKKWREFFIINDHFISGIKGYPYWNRRLEKQTLEWLRELFESAYANEGITISNEISEYEVDEPVYADDIEVEATRINIECGPAMYNDFYGGNEYNMYLTDRMGSFTTFYVDYSGVSECALCGQENDFDSEGDLVCTDCVEHHFCCVCGDQIYYSEDLYTFDDRDYCWRCYENLPTCDICDEVVDVGNQLGTIEFGTYIDLDKPYDRPNENNVVFEKNDSIFWRNREVKSIRACPHCAGHIFKEGRDEVMSRSHSYFNYNYNYTLMVPWSRLTEDGQKLFDAGDVARAKRSAKKAKEEEKDLKQTENTLWF
jgi:hypothetical protein